MAQVLTLTLNPAVDVTTTIDGIVADRKLRCRDVRRDPGGGGINVARVVARLGGDVVAAWTRGEPTGTLLEHLLARENIAAHEIAISEDTRESMTVMESTSGSQYRFVLPGPTLRADECERIAKYVETLSPAPAYLVLSGSLPPGVPAAFYRRLTGLAPRGTRVVVDTSGAALRELRGAGAFLLKPNLRELSELSGESLDSEQAIVRAARKLIENDTAQAVLVSMGGRGARIISASDDTYLRAPPVKPVSRVGAGDSTVGGLVYALTQGRDLVDAARFGVAAGSAAVMSSGTELCKREDTERLYAEMASTADGRA